MSLMLTIFTAFLATFAFTPENCKWRFMLWVCMLYFCIGGAFAVFPAYTHLCFGSKYFGSIYGMAFSSISRGWEGA